MGIADNPTVRAHDIISKNLTESLHNLSGRMMSSQGRKCKKSYIAKLSKIKAGQTFSPHTENRTKA